MKNFFKILIIVLAIAAAVVIVFAYASTIQPPRELAFRNQYYNSICKDIDKINNNYDHPELNTTYISILHELEFDYKESLLSSLQYDELMETFVRKYVPSYVSFCNREFNHSQWDENVLKNIQSHIKEILDLKTSDNSLIAGGEIKESLDVVVNVINSYFKAKDVAKASGYNGWDSAKSRIKTALDFAKSTPLCNCVDLVKRLNAVPEHLNDDHVKHLSNRVSELNNYYYSHSKDQFDKLSRDIWDEIDSYKKNAKTVYGTVNNISSIENNYNQYCRSANEYYSNISVSKTSLSFQSYGGSETLTVNSSESWNISINPNSWGHLSRNGNSLTLTVDANNSTSVRTDYFCVKCGSKEIRINISQNGYSSSSSNYSNVQVTGKVSKVWVDHNVNDPYGNKGMKIHVKFDINGMLNKTGQCAAYFYNSNGNPLEDSNHFYSTSNGNVATHVNFTPNYQNATFNDLSIFMPYSELHLSRNTSCYFTISLWNGNDEVAKSNKYNFDLTF